MIYRSNQSLPQKHQHHTYVFLAGSIDFNLKGNWRKRVVETRSDFHFIDPTCPNHDDLDDEQMQNHINWELGGMEMADYILLNFLPEAKSPISLVELGLYVRSGKLIVVCPTEFYQSRYVNTLCKKYNCPVYKNMAQVKLLKMKS